MYANKADNLIKLKENGFNVPEFDVVSQTTITNNYVPSFEAESYAVRSSCSCEDDDKHSFAGQFDTFLNVSKSDLNAKIKLVFESYNKLAKYEPAKKDIQDEQYAIVQKMIPSDYSGVIFTANPQGILNESVIVCGKGIGENVVTDKVSTTTYYYNKDDEVYYYEGTDNYLSGDLVHKLINLSNEIEKIFGELLDIEFAIKNNEIYILQVRKITTISSDNPLIFDNSNIVESYPGVSLPLTISFVHYIYTGVFKSAISRILKSEKQINSLKDVFDNMVGDCNGRLYYKISNWYEIILRLPFSNKILPIWRDMMGVNKSDILKSQKSHASLKVYYNFLKEIKNVPNSMISLNQKFDEVYSEYKKKDINTMSYEEIVKLYNSISEALFSDWDITLFNDMYTFLHTGFLKKHLKKKFSNYEEITNKLIAGNKNLESLKPVKSLISLAYSKNSDDYKAKFDEYIEIYGDRCVEELKLETKTFRTNPELLEKEVQKFVSNKEKFKDAFNEETKEIIESDFDKKTTKILEKCKLGIRNREISRLNRSRIFGMCREMFLRLGSILYQDNLIEDTRDVFYLTLDELLNKKIDSNTKSEIISKKDTYKIYYKLPAYSKIVFSNKEFNKVHLSINNEELISSQKELRGTPCSSGVCEGEVVVIDSVSNKNDVKDKIIVTKMTDPGWVFLIANAKGIISEKGSILSHTAIITRELHVPSIVGVKDLLKNLKTGDVVNMDANNGIIKIIDKEG